MVHSDISQFDWQTKTQTFVAEISCLVGITGGEKQITLDNAKSGKSVVFDFVNADMDGTKEDTYGWNYENKNEGLKLLIIND